MPAAQTVSRVIFPMKNQQTPAAEPIRPPKKTEISDEDGDAFLDDQDTNP